MVEFRFDIRPLFAEPIIKVTSNLLPHTFKGDRRQALDATSKMSEIIDQLGQLSAVSQKLNKPVTTAQRLRLADNQVLYLLADTNAGNNGSVIGLLKVGTKDLYLFDEVGQTRKVVNAPCILDFYIHESRQRTGLGKNMFETMLNEEHWTPLKCSVDRPSEKLLGFLKKHYGLERIIPQANNFVLYEGFFDDLDNANIADENKKDQQQQHQQSNGTHISGGPNTQLFGAPYVSDEMNTRRVRKQDGPHGVGAQITQISPAGRYGAKRPTCSMAEIIHSNATSPKRETESSSLISPSSTNDAVEGLATDLSNLQANDQPEEDDSTAIVTATSGVVKLEIAKADLQPSKIPTTTTTTTAELPPNASEEQVKSSDNNDGKTSSMDDNESGTDENVINPKKSPPVFQLSKQHTGMKNVSYGVGMAVTPTNKMEFDQELREEFGVVKINRPPAADKLNSPIAPTTDQTDAMSTVSSGEGLTDQGYYDLKFYHNKLW